MKPFPEVHVYMPFDQFNTCVEYKLVDAERFLIEPTGVQLPLSACSKMYCFKPEDQVKVNGWVKDARKYFETECKK